MKRMVLLVVIALCSLFIYIKTDRVILFIQEQLMILDDMTVGCASVVIKRSDFLVTISGGRRSGLKYFGLIKMNKEIEFEDYILLINGDSEEVHLWSMDRDSYVRSRAIIDGIKSGELSDYSSSYRVVIVDGYESLEGPMIRPDGLRSYKIPELYMSVDIKDIALSDLPVSVSKVIDCRYALSD